MGICICRKHEEYEDYTTFSEFIELIDEEVKHIEEISYIKNDMLAWKKIAMAFNWEKISNETLKVYFSI